jgi:hypothetical protein
MSAARKPTRTWEYRKTRYLPPRLPPVQPVTLSPATWDVYAASLTPEEMNKWFRRGT